MAVDFKVPDSIVCVNDTAHFQFLDTCINNFNYGMVDNMTWHYGDGTIDTVYNPDISNVNGTHMYDTPGNYNVMLVDRSEVNTPADKPKILYFEKLPN